MPRRLAITKRVSLEDLADGWTKDCYAIVIPANYAEFMEFSTLQSDGKTNTELVQYQLNFVKSHLVSGKVMTLTDDNTQVPDDIQPEDVDASKALADILFSEIAGVPIDPKDLSTVTETSSTLPDSSAL